jgi:hypothetical protein
MNDPRYPLSIVPESVQDKYDRDLHDYNVARKNLLESWQALTRCIYAGSEMADQGASPETET